MKPNNVLNRYLPFLLIAALQLVLVATQPSSNVATPSVGFQTGSGQTSGGFTGGFQGGAGTDSFGAGGGTVASGAVGGGAGAAGQAVGQPAGQPGRAAGAAQAAGTTAAGQPVDAMGRPLDGDRSKCAEGALVQQTVTRLSIPCMPKFVGDNGGATSQGVTEDEILAVYFLPRPNPELDAVLATQGLAVSPQRSEETLKLFEQFVNKHYELHGRKFKWVQHVGSCTEDPNCPRIEAKAIVEKYKPFLVNTWLTLHTVEAFVDELARANVIVMGGANRPDFWYERYAPYMWGYFPSSTTAVTNVSDYYCKRMSGKNATLAGDPVMRTQPRKLGIITLEVPEMVANAEELRNNVSGGMCGSGADDHKIYTLSTDAAQAQEQAQVLPTRMKNDDVTTVHNTAGGLACSANCDQQNYYPENYHGAPGPFDADVVHRLLQTSKTQADNTFGIGWYPDDNELEDHEFYRATRDVAPDYEPAYVTEGVFLGVHLSAMLAQWTGPYLTPDNWARAAASFPRINGWVNPNAWQGWTCCMPEVPLIKLGEGLGRFTATSDARHIYWSNTAVSKVDDKPGAWVCPDGCKRFEPGQWAAGEPKQP